jgi:tetratricopeptide (TPR) repeat protein
MSQLESDDLEQRFEALFAQIDQLTDECKYKSAVRVANEIRRLAKSEGQLVPYIRGLFIAMNYGVSCLEPETGRDHALELIAILENEDRARQLQPDLPEDEYDWYRSRFSSCAYDNFARAVANIQGFNSEGMHACINDGLQVCRRTGKLECLKCFREYAAEVYEAADDLEMALHNARLGIAHLDPGPHDRRWVGVKEEARLLLLQGQIEEALAGLQRGWSMRETYHDPHAATIEGGMLMKVLLTLNGRESELSQWVTPELSSKFSPPPRGEYAWYDLRADMFESFFAACAGDYPKAIQLLEQWDPQLRRQKCRDEWFHVRVQLIATLRYAGQTERIPGLAKQLEASATEARDYLTLRRLKRVMDPATATTPLALVGDVTVGPFAAPRKEPPSPLPTEENVPLAINDVPASITLPLAVEPERPPSALAPTIEAFIKELQGATSEPDISAVRAKVIAIPPESVTDDRDASKLLQLIKYSLTRTSDSAAVWAWAEAVGEQFGRMANIICHRAVLGAILTQFPGDHPAVSADRVTELFRTSMDLDPNSAFAHAQAGTFHLQQGSLSEAERCLSRACRLDRAASAPALQLAEVYSQTDRRRDGLAILDMCLREGTQDPDVAWEAALYAYGLEQYEPVLTYLDRFDQWKPNTPWSGHYRAAALLELERYGEALAAAEADSLVNPEAAYAALVQKVSACAGLVRDAECRTGLQEILATPLSNVTSLSVQGLARLHRRLWMALHVWAPTDPLVESYETFLIGTGLAPNEMFTAIREATGQVPIENGITFYRILMRQTMDDTWKDSVYCMSNEVEWTEYEVVWGVLAVSEEQARRLVVDMQGRAMDRTAEVLGVDEGGDGYTDIPGIVWQGLRDRSLDDDDSESEDADDDGDEEDDFDRDDDDDNDFGLEEEGDHEEP